MERAARIAQAKEFIDRMDDRYESQWKNGAITSLVVKNNGCRLRVVSLTNLRFLYWMTQHRLWMPSQKD
ncbi:hypothetical protein FGCSD_2152 (plasmid) [Streptococcus dysgalactiae]|nr:hypothetical protein FGCSD_2152 [Streptococcus dysgalactiae]